MRESPGQALLDLLAEFEGVRYEPYLDTGGVATIGIGHVIKSNERWIKSLTEAQVQDLFWFDMTPVMQYVSHLGVPLADHQQLALCSFIFNVGLGAFKKSTMLRKLQVGDIEGAANEFGRWIYDNGKVINGLVRRRMAEKLLFLGQDWKKALSL